MSAAPLPESQPTAVSLSQAISVAFVRSESALPEAIGAGSDPLGVSTFPRLRAYVRGTRSVELALKQVRRLASFGEGWDGYDAAPPSASGIQDACYLLERLAKDVNFTVDAEPDGSINLIADGNGIRVLLTFEGDERVSVAVRRNGTWHDEGTFGLRAGVNRLSAAIELAIYETL